MEKEDQKKISDPSEIPNENVDEISECVKPEASTEFSAEEQNPNIKSTTDMDVPEDKVDTEAGKCDDDQMETASTDNPFAYLERGDFSSERFKLELCNLPPRFGLSVCFCIFLYYVRFSMNYNHRFNINGKTKFSRKVKKIEISSN